MRSVTKLLVFLFLFVGAGFGQEPVNFGWAPPTPEQKALSKDNQYTQQLRDLVQYNDDSDALIYRFYYKAKEKYGLLSELEKRTGRLASLDQGGTGSCVSFGTTRALQVTAACDIFMRNEPEDYKLDFCPNAIYGIIRLDHLGRWDGATGAWATESINKYGTLHLTTYGSYDLRTASDRDARNWAAVGLPRELVEESKKHQVISSTIVRTPEEVKAAIQNGYGVILCANVSYSTTRDSLAFSARTPPGWGHCMACVGYRGTSSGREGYLISNSWSGPEGTWINGPIYPDDMIYGSFWITEENLKAHLKEGDSYAIAGYNGFKKRPLKWDEIFKIGEEINVEDN